MLIECAKKISIIIPVFNQADKITECLESIINQTYQNFEVIVVDDGSTDALEKSIDQFKLKIKNFNLIRQANQGAAVARNRGFKESTGDCLLFCDADIIMEPSMLFNMIEALENNPEASYAYSSFYWGKKKFRLFPFDSVRLKKMPYIHTTSLIKRKDFIGFDESLKRFQDWNLWLSMLDKGLTGVWVNKVLFTVKTGGTMSNWLPRIIYKIFPFLPQVKRYKQALKIIKEKHTK